MNSSSTPVLAISGTVPGEPGVGGVILEDLYRNSPAETLKFFPFPTRGAKESDLATNSVPLAGYAERKFETGYRPIRGYAGDALGYVARKVLYTKRCREIVDEVCESPHAQSCQQVWGILDCPTVIETAPLIAKKLNKPLIVLVWDAPELLIDRLNMDPWSGKWMMHSFEQNIKQAKRVGVICEQMERTYRQRYGNRDYVILRHGVGPQLWSTPAGESDESKLLIGFAGSITAPKAFEQLIQFLDANAWKINGREVSLRLIGCQYFLDSRSPQSIEFYGWRSQEETISLLSGCDFLYLPQPFADEFRILAELSFPTKLTTYLSAGRRILLHAPDYASLPPFFANHNVGIHCDTLSCEAIDLSIQQLMALSQQELSNSIQTARELHFSESVFAKQFQKLIRSDAN